MSTLNQHFAFVALALFLAHPAVAQTKPQTKPSDAWEVGKQVSLFDGKSLSGWTTADGRPAPSGWTVEDGCIVRANRGGNIFFHREVGDFDLRFEWKIVKGGNNGIKYRVRRYQGRMLGCEYQLLGETSPSFSKGSAGALYALFEPSKDKKLNPPEQWNRARIVAHGPRLEHWMNGVKIVDVEVGSEAWQQRLSQSKFAPYPTFARNNKGRIMITDHGAEVWYRNMVLTPLEPREIPPAPSPDAVSELSMEMAQTYGIDSSVYRQWGRTHNVLVLASEHVSKAAVAETLRQLEQLLSTMRPHMAQRIRDQHVVCVVKAADEALTGLPWLRDVEGLSERPAWAGKIGDRTVMAVCQEDVLGYAGDKDEESRLIRAFGELVYTAVFDARLKKRLADLYQVANNGEQWRDARPARRFRITSDAPLTLLDALTSAFPQHSPSFFEGLITQAAITVDGEPAEPNQTVDAKSEVLIHWQGEQECLALRSERDFWAEAVQSWFNANRAKDHEHNGVRTRAALTKYSPQLARLCEDVLRSFPWRFTGPKAKIEPQASPRPIATASWDATWQRLQNK